MTSRICASSISSSRGRLTEISLCFRFTELSSTVILKPSWEQSPRPYPVIDFIVADGGRTRLRCRIRNWAWLEPECILIPPPEREPSSARSVGIATSVFGYHRRAVACRGCCEPRTARAPPHGQSVTWWLYQDALLEPQGVFKRSRYRSAD